ncbi:MAG: NupC/NupG family nucleoside CNT transporter [Candidatus Melainabacteria bacterium]|nr:MAG: NupC/NupG family nucleoside CNT transporter [Candidatus Melainabacteria bacterium]RAI10135.1 MAG: NupC/NupG family nucleoside CNT transporter [Candidatus Melainabacteria bacterium]
MERFIGIIGMVILLVIAFALSNNKKAINYKTVGVGLALQIIFGIFIFKVPVGQKIFLWLGEVIVKLLEFANVGGKFVYGPLLDDKQMGTVFGCSIPFAFQLISATVFMMMIVNILYYYGIMQRVVTVLGKAMNKLMKVSGAEALSNVASAFVGQVTAQIMIKPYLAKLTRSELLASMAGSMACTSGAMMPVYAMMGIPIVYVLASAIMAIPGALVMTKLVYPETGEPETMENIKLSRRKTHSNVFDAIASGASEGMMVSLNVVAMLLAIVALIAMIDYILAAFGGCIANLFHLTGPVLGFDFQALSLKMILGKFFAIFALIMGVPVQDIFNVGGVIGLKIVSNEVYGYTDLVAIQNIISNKAFVIASFAICSFGNFGSIATQIGAIGGLAPNQRKNLARLGMRALICGVFTCFMSACIAGILVG